MELFEEGGLKDEGGMVDEVSGNDVPPGSTRKEVRDDIPAMLSEGEFIFPADVVRYFGLEKLMEMRQQAKMGLRVMDEMGQMGNSEEATIPDDLPFSPEDLILMEPQEFAQGGVVKAQQGMFVTPSIFANTQLSTPNFIPPSSIAPINASGTPTGYLPTFVNQPPVGTVTTPVDTGTTVDTGDNFVPEVGDVYEFRKYRNPQTGEIRDIAFYMNQPVIPIPDGFVPYVEGESDTVEDVTNTGVETAFVREDSDSNFELNTGLPTGGTVTPVGEMTNEQLMSGLGLAQTTARLAGPIASLINPIVGTIIGPMVKARYNDLLEESERRGLDTGDRERMGSVFGGEAGLYENLKDVSGDKKVTFADTWLGDLLGLDEGGPGVQGPGLKDSRQGARRDTTATATTTRQPTREATGTTTTTQPNVVRFDDGTTNLNPNTGRVSSDPNARFNETGQVAGTGWTGQRTPPAAPAAPATPPPSSSSRDTDSGSSASRGFYESVTGKQFKDTAVGKALGLGDRNDSSSDSGGSSSSGGGYRCYVATALAEEGYWSNTKKLKLIKWCIDTKPEDKFLTKLWRNGYVTFGKNIVAPFVSNPIVKWFADGYYEATVKNKKTTKAFLGLLFFTIPSYSIGLFKAVTGKLVEIERT